MATTRRWEACTSASRALTTAASCALRSASQAAGVSPASASCWSARPASNRRSIGPDSSDRTTYLPGAGAARTSRPAGSTHRASPGTANCTPRIAPLKSLSAVSGPDSRVPSRLTAARVRIVRIPALHSTAPTTATARGSTTSRGTDGVVAPQPAHRRASEPASSPRVRATAPMRPRGTDEGCLAGRWLPRGSPRRWSAHR